VLLIVTDDQRWDTLPYMPAVQAELVGKGVTFTNSFTVSPLCCPARATILTGTYPHTHGVWANNGPWSAPRQFDDDWHLGVWLQQAGYRTGMFGKFFNNWGHPARAPGFGRWFAFHSPGGTQPYFDYPVDADGELRWYGPAEGNYSTDVVAHEAEAFVREPGPWFAYVAPFAPHFPTIPAPRHADATFGATEGYPLAYLRTLLGVDDLVARLVATLRETGQLEDTVIVYTSDNGFHIGEQGLTGSKETPYEASIRVPLVVRYDALGAPAHQEPALAGNVDIAQTVLELAGVHVPHQFEGASLAPLLTQEAVPWRRTIEIEYRGRPDVFRSFCQLRGPDWSYVQYEDGEEAYWDLARDPGQGTNLAGQLDRRRLVGLRTAVQQSSCRPPPEFEPLLPPPCTADCEPAARRQPDRPMRVAGGVIGLGVR
jgi:arylsulfatase A-like enzyme